MQDYEVKELDNGGYRMTVIADPEDKASYFYAESEDGTLWKYYRGEVGDPGYYYNPELDEEGTHDEIAGTLRDLNLHVAPVK